MNWDSQLAQFVIVAGRKGPGHGFDLWQWRADIETGASKIVGMIELLPKGTEGLTRFVSKTQSGMLLVIDDGSLQKSRPAHYQLFPK